MGIHNNLFAKRANFDIINEKRAKCIIVLLNRCKRFRFKKIQVKV